MERKNQLAAVLCLLVAVFATWSAAAVDPRTKHPQAPIDEVALKAHGATGNHTTAPRNTVSYSGTIVGGPQWDRPILCTSDISALGPVRYHVQPFTVDTSGAYDLTSVQSYDGYLHLYANSFNPAPPNQTTNCQSSSDDGIGGIGTSEILGEPLVAGTTYFLVTSAFSVDDEGTFSNTLTGPGIITLGGLGPDVAITATTTATSATAGDRFDIDLAVTNNGPGDATGVDVSAVLSANLSFISATCGTFPWAIGTLAEGASVACTVTVELGTCGEATFTATVASDDFEDISNNSDSVSVNANSVADPSYEAGTPNPSWTEASTNFGTPLCTEDLCGTGTGTGPRTGDWWSWFGGFSAGFEESSTTQSITIPTGDSALLSFYFEAFVCNDSALDFLEVTLDGNQLYLVDGTSPLCGTLGYTLQSIDVTAYADGASHTLAFHSITNSGGTTNFFVDDISVVACSSAGPPPPPPDAPGPPGIPTLDTVGLGILAALLAMGATLVIARRRRALM